MVTYEIGLSHSISVDEETMLAKWLQPKFSTIFDLTKSTKSNDTSNLNKTGDVDNQNQTEEIPEQFPLGL